MIPWVLANFFLCAVTWWTWRWLRLGSSIMDPLIYLYLYLFNTTSLVLLCGLAGVLHPLPIGLVTGAGACALGWLGREEIRHWTRESGRFVTSLRGRRLSELVPEGLFCGVVLVLAARIAIHIWYLPPYVTDTLTYHLPKVAEWVQNGSLVIFDTSVDRTFWPANFELFQTWFVLFPHHDFLVELACVPFYLLACWSVYSIARLLGLEHRWGLAAALLYALTPAPLQHATSSKNDMPMAALYLFLFALLLSARKEGWSWPRRRLFLAFLVCCHALGMKAYIVFLLPGLVVVILWALEGHSLRDLLLSLRKPELRSPGAGLLTWLPSVALTSVALLLGGYWYLRNGLIFGNPFYPAEPRIFGQYFFGSSPEGWQRQGVFLSHQALVDNLSTLFQQKIFDTQEFHFSLTDMTGWGWFVFVVGWPSLVYGTFSSSKIRWLFAAFGLSFLTLLSCVVSDPWYMRFAQWVPALFVLSFLLVLRESRLNGMRHGVFAVATVCTLLNFVGSLDIGKLPPWMWLRMSTFPVAERSTAALGLFVGRGYFDTLQTIPAQEAIGYNTNHNGWIYPLYDADYSRQVRFVPIEAETDIVQAMRLRDVRYLFTVLPSPVVQARVAQAVARGKLREINRGLYVVRD